MSRRDGAIVAWHEVPGTAPPQKSRPVGYGVIRAGVRTDFDDRSDEISNTKTEKISDWIDQTFPDHRNFAWQRGYGAFQRWYLAGTVHYIEQQLEHHRRRTF